MNINEEWKKTCKILLGSEIGELEKYEKYLWKYIEPVKVSKSAFSEKRIAISGGSPIDTRFIARDEMEEYQKKFDFVPLPINALKDIDSLLGAVRERAYYAGDIQLGNSSDLAISNRVIDSVDCFKSHEVSYSKHISHSHFARFSECMFGSSFFSKTKFGIKNYETYEDVRIMETIRTYSSSDCYYTSNLEGCQNCLFSFNLRNARNRIGNLELPADKFQVLKQKLVGEITQTLKAKGEVPSILEIIAAKGAS